MSDTIHPISRESFDRFSPHRHPALVDLFREVEWYRDETSRFVAVLTEDQEDRDWAFAIMAYDPESHEFCAADWEVGIKGQGEAREMLLARLHAASEASQTKIVTDLFAPIVTDSQLHPNFRDISTRHGYWPARQLMNEVFQGFPDPDGNFLQQFQTHGFETRLFELFVYTYLIKSGYEVDRRYNRPDFLVTKDGVTAAIEATTVNPSQSGAAVDDFSLKDDTPEELAKTINERLPIKLGSPLFSKLKMRYWELEQCKGIPLVFFIQNFQADRSLFFSCSSLGQYLFGLRHDHHHDATGTLIIEDVEVQEHRVGGKVIPSRFFGQPDTEHISAVVFCNTGTTTKFNRMAYQSGVGRTDIEMLRAGMCYDPDPNASSPLQFKYHVADPPRPETWGQGLSVYLNPNAKHPLPDLYFADAAQHYIEQGRFTSDIPPFHIMTSQTVILSPKDQTEPDDG